MIAVIEAESELMEIELQILNGYLVLGTHKAAFEETPHILYSIRAGSAMGIALDLVEAAMGGLGAIEPEVRSKLIDMQLWVSRARGRNEARYWQLRPGGLL